MKNIFKKSLLFIMVGLTASIVSAETMYVISGQCNVPLAAGMNNAKNSQFFTWDGSTATVTTAVTCDITSTAGFYYNSTSLAYADIANASNYSSSSSSSRTMRGFKITGSQTMTIGLGSIAVSKIIVGGRCASNDACSLNVAGETVSTNNKNSFVKVVEGTFTNQIQIVNSSGKEYNVIVYLIEGAAGPVAVTGVTLNKTALSIEAGQTEQLTASVLPANADDPSVTWSSSNTTVASVDGNGLVTANAAGSATITVTTKDGNKTATCTVTVTAPPAPIEVESIALKTTATIGIGASETLSVTYSPADANTGKAITWTSGNTAVATVDANGQVTGVAAGTATITATTANGKTATCTVTVTAGPPVPSTDLTLHVPEVYEARAVAGGYDGTLAEIGGHEYEVYYMTRDGDSKFCIATTSADKTAGITNRSSDYAVAAKDGWFKFSGTGWSSSSEVMGDEFGTMARRLDMDNSCEFSMHISGFDQFALVARDKKQDTSSGQTKPDDNRYLEVYIDDILQPLQFNSTPSVRRYNISSGEHVVRVIHHGSDKSAMYGFSLRVAQEPRTKYLKGNDSTQVVMQTAAIRPVTYVTKYNNIPGAETKLEWIGNEATGISLEKTPGSLTDTLVLNGQANCAVGTYNYAVVAYYNNVETSRATGKFKVASDIQATSETNVEVYQNEEMDQITFNYFALSANDVQLTWTNTTPAGISGTGNNGKYIIGGTPTTIGTYPFTITVLGADTVISGQLTVKELNYGIDPILYLYKNNLSYEKDGIHKYLKSKGKNLIERKAKIDGLRPADQYAHYKWVLISEDVDADNAEVLAIIRGGANLPVLNLKGFTYTSDRLNWGEPDNGAIDSTATKDKGCNIWIEQSSHPVFAQLTNKNRGDKVKILSSYERNGVMPIAINNAQGTLCLATGMTRSIEDYYAEGELQTAIHEVPAEMRGGYKYICLPLAREITLSTEGEKLINGIETYLLNNAASGVVIPKLEIQSFTVNGIAANIDQEKDIITLRLSDDQFAKFDSLKAVRPVITLADPNTHVLPEGEVNLQYMYVIAKDFVVTDYISRRVYEFYVDLYDPHQDIEQVYEAGQWVNIFDIYGRKVATTNENIYSMELPRGMYIVVTENGQTMKIMK